MAETVGRVDFIAGLDGRTAVRESKELGEKIGAEGDKAGAGYGDRFERELTPRMKLAADKAARALSSGLQLDGRVLDRSKADIDRFSNSVTGEFRKMSRETREAFGDMFPNVDAVLGRVNARFRETWDSLDEGEFHFRKLNLSWQDLSHNTRQWTLIIGAVLSSMEELSGLSSALGAGLFAVGGALSSVVLGAGSAVAIFSVLAKDVGELPPELQETARQFKALGTELKGTRDIIASAAIQQMPNTFSRLSETVKGLNPSLASLGSAVGKVMDDFSKGVEQGTDGFVELRRLVDNATDDFPKLASASGTWATALLRGLNRANPIVEQLIGYVDKLGKRFDAFTRSSNFDTWVQNSMVTFSKFGALLDATGRMLNDLVTPESLQRTQAFLDNLTAFMPNLGKLLGMLGELNIFGLASQLLRDFGEALEPLAAPMTKLASGLNDVASVLIGTLADALTGVATVAAPVVEVLARIVTALPPEALSGVVLVLGGLAAAFSLLNAVNGVAAAAQALGLFSTAAGAAQTATGKLTTGLKGLAGKAGLYGLLAVGIYTALDAVADWAKEISGVDEIARKAVTGNKSLIDSYNEMQGVSRELTPPLKDVSKALDDIGSIQPGNSFSLIPHMFDEAGASAIGLASTLGQLDKELAPLASANLPAATQQFAAWATEVGATDEQILNMLNNMPGLKKAIEDAALSQGYLATNSDLVRIAMGGGVTASEEMASGLELMDVGAQGATGSINDTADAIRKLAEEIFGTRSKARDFEASIDDLAATIVENLGAGLDITTEKGRANEAAIDAMAQAALNYADDIRKTTGDQAAANAVIGQGRTELINTLAQFGITGQAAEDYADKLGLVPVDISTAVEQPGMTDALLSTLNLDRQLRGLPPLTMADIAQPGMSQAQIDTLNLDRRLRGLPPLVSTNVALQGAEAAQAKIDQLARDRTMNIRITTSGEVKVGNRTVTPFATGGTVLGPTRALVGEAGPEAIVPLRRPLNQVDPSVRWLSAIAQGMPALAGGAITGAGKQIIIEAGAIVVQGAENPRETALEVQDAVADLIGS